MEYLLLVCSIFCAVINSIALHKMKDKLTSADMCLFNSLVSIIWIAIYLSAALLDGERRFSAYTFLFGGLYGVVTACFLLFKLKALLLGSMVLTTMVGCSSFVVTTLFNAIYWHEQITIVKALCLLCLLFAIGLILLPAKHGERAVLSRRWILYCLLLFLTSAAVGTIFRFHQTFDQPNTNVMCVIAASVSAAILMLARLVGARNTAGTTPKATIPVIPLIVSGVSGGIYNRLNIHLAGVMPSIVLFPVFNGAVVVLSALAGVYVFHERTTPLQKAGIVLGCTAILGVSLT